MMVLLDRQRGAEPLYHQIENILKKKIEDGELPTGSVLPPERDLIQTYEVSRITVRQALNNLARDGYVEGRPGIGTIVKYKKINESLKKVVSFSEEMKLHGIIMTTSLCNVSEVVAPKKVSEELGLGEGEKCVRLERVRCADGSPLVYSVTFWSSEWHLPLDKRNYEDSLYKYISSKQGIFITKATDTLEAVVADEKIAKILEISKGMAVFKRVRKSYDQKNRIFEYTICYYPGDKYKYTIEL